MALICAGFCDWKTHSSPIWLQEVYQSQNSAHKLKLRAHSTTNPFFHLRFPMTKHRQSPWHAQDNMDEQGSEQHLGG